MKEIDLVNDSKNHSIKWRSSSEYNQSSTLGEIWSDALEIANLKICLYSPSPSDMWVWIYSVGPDERYWEARKRPTHYLYDLRYLYQLNVNWVHIHNQKLGPLIMNCKYKPIN